MKTITISEEEYDQLLSDSKFLTALIFAGVDNWEGYDEAVQICEEDED